MTSHVLCSHLMDLDKIMRVRNKILTYDILNMKFFGKRNGV